MANAYFIFLTLLQCIPGFTDYFGAASTLLPVFLVSSLSMIKDAFEDNKRRKSDNEENRTGYECMPRGMQAF